MKEKFGDLWKRLGVKEGFEEEFKIVKSAYSAKGRYYHNLQHIEFGLERIKEANKVIDFPNALELAWFYHDFVYNPNAKDNEEKSAEYCRNVCEGKKLRKDFIERIERLIIATKHLFVPRENDEKLIVDIDLSIFGQKEKIFDEYESNIRKEYSFVRDEDFRKGRKEILERFLNRDSIYLTDFFRRKYEKRARENLERSIIKLS